MENHALDRSKLLDPVVEFLSNLGLTVSPRSDQPGFRGCKLVAGTLLFDPSCPVSDLIKKAGHLAVVPQVYRHRMNGDIARSVFLIYREARSLRLEPDHPVYRALLHCGDCEATAWAWAAGCALGLRPQDIIRNKDYDGTGAHLRSYLASLEYVGIHGLPAAGMCLLPQQGGYPQMKKWLQDAAFEPQPREAEGALAG